METCGVEKFYEDNKSYYDRNASRYEKASWYYFNAYKNREVDREIKVCLSLLNKQELRVLEIGPGAGYLLGKLLPAAKSKNIFYTGIEHSNEMSHILRTRYSAMCPQFKIINSSVSGQSSSALLDDNKYDLIIGSSVLHHIVDYDAVMMSLAEHLAPGGIMYFVREPIHKEDCKALRGATLLVASILGSFYDLINGILMLPAVRRKLYPGKLKAEDASRIAYHMFKDGVSIRVFQRLVSEDKFSMVFHRRYNRRVSATFSYLENKWLQKWRKDIFGNTLYSICIQKQE